MLDLAHEETSLEAKRRELTSRIAEGHQVVDALMAHQAATARKIEEALEGVEHLQEQLRALDTVIGMVGHQEVCVQPARPAPVLEVVPAPVEQPSVPLKSQPFRPMSYLKCVAEGHNFMNSRAMPGYVTCRRCRMRRRG